MDFTAVDCSLSEFLRAQEPLRMAPYQRRYEWQQLEFETLYYDLLYASGLDGDADQQAGKSSYFLNTIILHRDTYGQLLVVDGQQRLTSLTLLLLAGREVFDDEDTRNFVNNYLLLPAESIHDLSRPRRIILHRGDDEYLETLFAVGLGKPEALGDQARVSHHRLRNNFLTARRLVSDLDAQQLRDFLNYILTSTRFIRIDVPKDSDPFQIFEAVNKRGKPLRELEAVRFALVNQAAGSEGDRDELLSLWATADADQGPEYIDDLIATWRVMALKGRRSNRSALREISQTLKTQSEAYQFLKTELMPDTSRNLQIAEASIPMEPGAQRDSVILSLRSLKLTDDPNNRMGWVPVARLIVNRFQGDDEALADLLGRLDCLAWFLYAGGSLKGARTDRRSRFEGVAKAICDDETGLAELKGHLALSDYEKGVFRDWILQSHEPKSPYLRSLLARLELTLGDGHIDLARGDISVEHVLPVSPAEGSDWMTLYSDAGTRRRYARKLGNLCAIPQSLNAQLGNASYSEKRPQVIAEGAAGRYRTAADFKSEESWPSELIDRRTQEFMKALYDGFDIHHQGYKKR